MIICSCWSVVVAKDSVSLTTEKKIIKFLRWIYRSFDWLLISLPLRIRPKRKNSCLDTKKKRGERKNITSNIFLSFATDKELQEKNRRRPKWRKLKRKLGERKREEKMRYTVNANSKINKHHYFFFISLHRTPMQANAIVVSQPERIKCNFVVIVVVVV